MGIYAGLGASQALGFFFMGMMFAFLTYFASRQLHRVSTGQAPLCQVTPDMFIALFQDAIERVMHAPMSFFETTVGPSVGISIFVIHIFLSRWAES